MKKYIPIAILIFILSAVALIASAGRAATASAPATPVAIEYKDITWEEYLNRAQAEAQRNVIPNLKVIVDPAAPLPPFPIYRQTEFNFQTGKLTVERIGAERAEKK